MIMEKLIEEMRELTGNAYFISSTEICDFLGLSYKTVSRIIKYIRPVRGRYHIPDVAEAIMNDVRYGHEK